MIRKNFRQGQFSGDGGIQSVKWFLPEAGVDSDRNVIPHSLPVSC